MPEATTLSWCLTHTRLFFDEAGWVAQSSTRRRKRLHVVRFHHLFLPCVVERISVQRHIVQHTFKPAFQRLQTCPDPSRLWSAPCSNTSGRDGSVIRPAPIYGSCNHSTVEAPWGALIAGAPRRRASSGRTRSEARHLSLNSGRWGQDSSRDARNDSSSEAC